MRVTVCKGGGADLGVWGGGGPGGVDIGGGGPGGVRGGRTWGCGHWGGELGGVVVSEFSVAWGKREEGGQGREGDQLPDSLMDEAVLQSAGPRLETPP